MPRGSVVGCEVSDEQLWSWIDRDAPELEQHLAGCPACRKRAAEIRAGIETVKHTPPTTPRRLPESIGSYRIKRLLGEGGMGIVYEAEQASPHRAVALKVVRGGAYVDEHQVKLFQREAQALARLKHSSIGAIYEAGRTEDGQHFFAMELVRGEPLLEYARVKILSIRERLELFRKICEAINYAHQRGVMHRDLKPSNILIDADANPKILDFGLARITDADVAVTTVATEIGKIQGTLPYMSPEQARGNPDEIDLRSDVYSLGVILYELLTGQLPYDVNRAMLHEAVRVICDEPPRKPSTISRALRGDVETIALKALEKEPPRRYQSASALSDDIERYLTEQPILGRPPSAMYQLRKLVVRHKAPVGFAMALFVVVTAFAVIATVQAIRITEQRDRIAEERDRAVVAEAKAKEAKAAEVEQRLLAERETDRARCQLYANQIALADSAYQNLEMRRMKRVLEACDPDLRGWEWYWLTRLTDRSFLTLDGHETDVEVVSFTPDGRRILSMGEDQMIKIWDVETGQVLLTWCAGEQPAKARTHWAAVCAAVSPDGMRIVSSANRAYRGTDNNLKVWDSTTGQELLTLRGHTGLVSCAAFSPDGSRIVSGSWDNTLKLWDAVTGQELRTLSGHEHIIACVAFSPDGSRIVSGSWDGTLRLWDAVTGQELKVLNGHERGVACVAFTPDGRQVVSGGGDKTLKLWDTDSGRELRTLRGHEDGVTSIGISPDGRKIASASRDKTIRLWDVEAGTEPLTLRGHDDWISSVAFSPSGKQIVSGSNDKTLKLWNADGGDTVLTLRSRYGNVTDLAFGPSGRSLVTGHVGVSLWNIDSGEESLRVLVNRMVSTVAFSPDGCQFASGTSEEIRTWDAATGEALLTLPAGGSLAFSLDGKRIVSGDSDGRIRVWDARSGKELLATSGHEDRVNCVGFNADGSQIVSGGFDGTLRIWDAETGKELITLRADGDSVSAIAVDPSTKNRIAAASADGTIKLWDTATGEELLTFRGHESGVSGLDFSPDGRRIVSGGLDSTVKLWDVASGQELLTLRGHEWGVCDVDFAPDGRRIASVGSLYIKVWELDDPPPRALAERNAAAAARDVFYSLAEHLLLVDEIIEHLRSDSALSDSERAAAIRLARVWGDAPSNKLNGEAWRIVKSPERLATEYGRARRLADAACQQQPQNGSYLNTLGVAQYRVGSFEDALTTLVRSDELKADIPSNMAFIAMAHYRLGNGEQARAELGRLRDLMKDPKYAEDEDARAFLDEAEALISGEAGPSVEDEQE